MPSGYYGFPTIHRDTVVFTCEDDLWTVPAEGGVARRLTSGLAEAAHPVLSKDGRFLAFTGREEGQPEVYLMPAEGGPARRVTYLGGHFCFTTGWTDDGRILFANSAGRPFGRLTYLYSVDVGGNTPVHIEVGPARSISFSPDGASGRVIGRNSREPAYWKRYRGGRTGQIWIDETGDGNFRPLNNLQGNLATPMWIGQRIYFLSDHEGIGNLYSCRPDGEDVRRHTDHETYYARNASTDGRRITYHAGGDLYLFDPSDDSVNLIPLTFYSPRTQHNRKFIEASHYLEGYALHPDGHSLAIVARGKAFTFPNWEEAVMSHGFDSRDLAAEEPRFRLLNWLNDGKRLIAVTDAGGEESFVILAADGNEKPEIVGGLDIGRPMSLTINPKKDQVLFSNHRYEICLLDLVTRELSVIDRGNSSPIAGFDWSPDGEWAAYSVSVSLQVTVLKLWEAKTGEIYTITKPVLRDVGPAFDPQGRYLYFLSHRHFDPVYDNIQFDLGFPRGVRPYLITLAKDQPSPFKPRPAAPGQEHKAEEGASGGQKTDPDAEASENAEKPLQIDVEGIENRILAFPVDEGQYGRIMGTKDGRALYSRFPVEGALSTTWLPEVPPAKGQLFVYDFSEQKEKKLESGISSFDLSRNRASLVYRAGNRLRVLKAGDEPADDDDRKPGRKSGWIDLSRVKVAVIPALEWRQMYREAWRLQRDQFWTPNMSGVDWLAVYERYLPLVERAGSRSEFSDLVWEMQGELGTSHGYEIGGDYRPEPRYDQGYLGADFEYDEASDSWRILHIVRGDAWDERSNSPLLGPAINVEEGDRLRAINGRRLSRIFSPAKALVHLAGEDVRLTFSGREDDSPRSVTVKTLFDESSARYREWVDGNRKMVFELTGGRVGYIHIPDMGPYGYAEFHRAYLAEIDREGLIVDIRFNGGGHVSGLILEKLARKRLGYDVARWSQDPEPYPPESILGPIVAITNEYAGSDGDIFSHGFKMLELGPLIGKRTWGGVVGINPRHRLVDGTVTTQPEFSFWFKDVGWGVENYGTEPDIEVDNRPQDYAQGEDAQLKRAIEEINAQLAADPPQVPAFSNRPSLPLPKLPPR